jgi:hypothetical protein
VPGKDPLERPPSVESFHLKKCKLKFEGSFQVNCPHSRLSGGFSARGLSKGSFLATSLTVYTVCISESQVFITGRTIQQCKQIEIHMYCTIP